MPIMGVDWPRGAMDRRQDVDHATRWFGLRFQSVRTERQYREWRIATAMSFARIGYLGSAPSWFLLLAAFIVLLPETVPTVAPLIIGWILLLSALTAMTFPASLRRTVMPLAAAANCLAGFLIVYLVFDVAESGLAVQSRAGVMTAGLLIVMFFGFAIFRISPGLAMLAITPYALFGSYQLYDAHGAGDLTAVEAGSLGAAQWIAFCGCLLVCIVIEVVTRRTFCKDQIIEAQQRELRTSRETIRRYVPPTVVEHIIHGDTAGIDVPSRRRVTVLFGDLVDFTPIAERVEAEVLTTVVNDYLTAMSQIVAGHGGTVNEFAGDGFMALFGAPDELAPEDQALSAVRAAAALQAHIPALNAAWARLGVPTPLAMRIGINTGVLSVGSFGSDGRMTYTAIGLETNIAARIQSNCEPGGILMSETTWQLVNDRITCEPRGEVACKGVRHPVRVHAPTTVGLD